MKIKYLFSALLLLISLIAVPSVLAGGAIFMVYADTNPLSVANGYGRIIRVYINPKQFPCQESELTFKFVDSKDGDSITTGANGSTYTMQQGCETYAKMISKESGQRQVEVDLKNGNYYPTSWTINVDFDGQDHAENIGAGYPYRSSLTNPYIDSNIINTDPTPTPTAIPTVIAPTNMPTIVPSQNPNPTIIYVNNGNDQKVNDLNKKVGDLQNQLDQSKKKQSFLEQRLSDLINFIKKIFPFFK